ncbi:MAG: GT4 family glycosyltransferase PelF [Gammaproteobacteria bacterium]|nr:GT4 family glycosyltransferase PelF [Gammaproteobacteria bacterium]MCW5584204.1 GT4 family glycosyltransferase PelF [Gammaproteobacteria bacterium]
MNKWLRKTDQVDICLLLEGSYPFVLGGVSTWVHKIIQAFPEYRFGIVFLGSRPEDYVNGPHYELPNNVVHFEIHYLFVDQNSSPKSVHINPACYQQMSDMHEGFRGKYENYNELFQHLDFYLKSKGGITKEQFFYAKESWDYITEQYSTYSSEPSFIDYFWTIKNIHEPLWVLPKIVRHLPKAKLVHALSTGYAGFLGTLLHNQFGCPLVLSEHGIYTKERRIEILSSNIFRDINFLQEDIVSVSYLRTLWSNFFESLAKTCYAAADPVISLFQGANHIQLEYGVEKAKTEIIPNGVDINFYADLYRPLAEKPKHVVGFIGRVVPIKDVKTFIRSIALVKHQIQTIEAWLVGSLEEAPEYVIECQDLIRSLELEQYVKIIPTQDLRTIYPQLQLIVLSSISEGMPLVVLEGNAAGIPVIATDVGACRELIEGRAGDDARLGKSGLIVKMADPEDLANAIVSLLTNSSEWERASQAGMSRVKQYYDQDTMFTQYRNIYQKRLI